MTSENNRKMCVTTWEYAAATDDDSNGDFIDNNESIIMMK